MSPRFLAITALLVTVLSTIAVAALAQAGSAVQSLAGPRTLRVVSHRRTEHGCGMSYGSSSSELTLVLSIDRAGGAMLAIDGHSRSRITSRGPAGGSSETGHAVGGVARGTASLDGAGQLTIRFVDLDVRTAYWSGPGTAPVGPSTVHSFAHALICTVESAMLLPAGAPSPGDVGVSTALAHCVWSSGVPSELSGYTEGDIWLGASSGIDLNRDDTLLEPVAVVTLRAR